MTLLGVVRVETPNAHVTGWSILERLSVHGDFQPLTVGFLF